MRDGAVFTPEALERIAPGRAKHAPGERRVDQESAPRATRFNASVVLKWRDHGLQVAEPAAT